MAAGTEAGYCIRCVRCGAEPDDRTAYLYRCPGCGGILDAVYDLAGRSGPAQLFGGGPGLWEFRALLPLPPDAAPLSLGEGGTPLLDASHLTPDYGDVQILLKLEMLNPTGSFKDRAAAVGVARARQVGASALVLSSTGNAGAAAAAYGARAGLPVVVLVPAAMPAESLAQIAAYGARIVRVAGDVSGPFHLARAAAAQLGWVNLATTYESPYPTEGDKTAGYEIARQLGWQVPDWIVVPVGAGPLLYACWKAFTELRALGAVDRLPRMAAVQASGCAPLYRAWRARQDEVTAWESVDTIAKGIADPLRGYPDDGTFTLRTVRRSGGAVVAVTDGEILRARDDLARRAGIFAEPTGAVPLAGLARMNEERIITAGQKVVLLVTGSGLKGQFPPVPEAPLLTGGVPELARFGQPE
jgi:threonine synthase